ncbi:uncharacterized protein [Montipora foliosa]|uniref:uncharacterized protein n=1 Tax=Montipora foliosa TaxID=591990 RepID=UPI0035F1BEBA
MPHLKVNVNGKRYTISGLTRRTCSKQILCALAKVDTELRASTAFTEKVNSETDLNDSPNENRGERTEQAAHKTRRRSKGEDKLNNCDGREGKTKYGKEHTNREARSFKKTSGMDSKGSQTSNGMLETLRQDCRLATQHWERDVKLEVRPKTTCSDMSKNEDTKNIGNINAETQRETIAGGNPKDTDQDTGISELYSDSSFENNQLLKNSEKESATENSAGKNLSHALPLKAKCASTNTDPMETARNVTDEKEILLENYFIVAQLIGSEAARKSDDKGPSACIYVDSDSEELRAEIKRIESDLKLIETKIVEQNEMTKWLSTELMQDITSHENDIANGNSRETKRIDELEQDIKLSNQLYDYQKLEMLASSLELDRVESQIRRKRWHVESLLKELCRVRKNSPERCRHGKAMNYLREGTLV